MGPILGDQFTAYLETLASRFYPGLYALIDEPVDDLLGETDLKAHLILGHSPAMRPADVTAVVMVSATPLTSDSLPPEWKRILESSRNKSLRVDLFVSRRDAARVQRWAREMNPRASVIALPQDLRRPPAYRSALV